jgi:uncharacterized protein (DUF2147 family)
MVKHIFTTILLTIISITTYSQADNVIGYWLTEEGDSQIQIVKATNGKYYGKVVWMKEKKDKTDTENSTPALRTRKIMGLQILYNFVYDKDDKEWIDGKIYDPNNGSIYSCYMWFEGNNNMLKIKGYVMGMKFLGRETTWKRENTIRF